MKNNSLRKNKKLLNGISLFCFFLVFLFWPASSCHAGLSDFVLDAASATTMAIVGTLTQIIVWVMGVIISIVIWAIVHIAKYNNFINESSIVNAWVIVRDFCNMFFVVVLLLIAFATILKQENYSAKKLLPKLVIMAILINFSRTICGVLIDLSQIVMLTFISAIGDAGGNIANTLGVQNYLNQVRKAPWGGEMNLMSTVGGLILGIIFLVIAASVLVTILGILVVRIVMLWVYIVLSPLAFLLLAVPKGEKYYNQWWSDFVSNVVTGPILAFFLWLALASVNQMEIVGKGAACFGPVGIVCPSEFSNFIVAIGMLMGGLAIASKMGGEAGKIAGKGSDWAKKAPKLLGAGAMGVGGWSARKIKSSEGRFGGLELNPMNIYRGIKEGFAEKKRKEISEGEAKSADALRAGGIGGLVKGLGASKDMTEAMARGWFGIKGMQLAYNTAMAPRRRAELEELEEQKKPTEKIINDYKEKMSGDQLAINQYEAKNRRLKMLQDKEASGEPLSPKEEESIKKLQKEIKNIDINKHRNKVAGYQANIDEENVKIKAIDDEIKSRKEKSAVRTPFTFSANMGRKKNVREAMSKIGDNDNADDLIDMWRHAKAVGDKEMAAAVFLAAAKNGHSNEIIMAEKGTDKNSKFFDKTYDTDQDGLNAFVNDQLIGYLGMAKQEAIDYQSQFSSICKSAGHFMFAESVGSKNGMLYQKTAEDQERDSASEARKVDPEKYTRDRNRFGYGKEVDDGSGRRFRFNELGLSRVMENASIIEIEINKDRFNKNAAMKMLDDMDTLKAYVKATGKDTYTTIDKNGDEVEKSWKNLFAQIEAYGQAAKQSGTYAYKSAARGVIETRDKTPTA